MSGVSTLGQALDQIEKIKTQQLKFGILSTQLSTGKKTQEFSGLGTSVLTSKRARADFTSLDKYIENIKNTDRRIQLMSIAIDEFKEQTEHFATALVHFAQQSTHQEDRVVYWDDPTTTAIENIALGVDTDQPDVDFRTLQQLASNIFDFAVDLLNQQEGDRYLLGGAETLTKPLGSTDTLDSAMSTLLAGWKDGTISTEDFIDDLVDRSASSGNPNAITDSVIGYNAVLSNGDSGNVYARVSDTAEIEYTVLANDRSFRDVLVALAYIKNGDLPPAVDEVEIDPGTGLPVIITEGAPGDTLDDMKENFFAVFNQLTGMVNKAIDDIDQLRFKIESVRARLDTIKTNYTNQKNLLQTTISDVENVDINEVALTINTLQIQLEASYRVTALTSQLSLVNFMGV